MTRQYKRLNKNTHNNSSIWTVTKLAGVLRARVLRDGDLVGAVDSTNSPLHPPRPHPDFTPEAERYPNPTPFDAYPSTKSRQALP